MCVRVCVCVCVYVCVCVFECVLMPVCPVGVCVLMPVCPVCCQDQFRRAPPVQGGIGMFLLQKMGWKPGDGLGKDNEGSREPLMLDVKMDRKGNTLTGCVTVRSGKTDGWGGCDSDVR